MKRVLTLILLMASAAALALIVFKTFHQSFNQSIADETPGANESVSVQSKKSAHPAQVKDSRLLEDPQTPLPEQEKLDSLPGVLSGKVMGPDIKPVSGCEILLEREWWCYYGDWRGLEKQERHTVLSNASGEFIFKSLDPGLYKLTFKASGYVLTCCEDDIWVCPEANVVQTLARSAVLKGSVVENLSGAPIEGATISARISSADRSPYHDPGFFKHYELAALSDKEGNFIFDMLYPDKPYTLTIQHARYLDAQKEEVMPGSTENISIVLSPGASIQGIVLSATDDSPVAGARVRVMPPNLYYEMTKKETRSATDGTFLIEGLEAGDYVCKANWGEYITTDEDEYNMRSVELYKETEPVRIKLVKGGAIEWTVLDDNNGIPIRCAQVMIYPDGMTPPRLTDKNGWIRFGGLQRGKYRFRIQAKGYVPQTTADRESSKIVIRPGETLRKVSRLKTGKNVAGKVVDATGDPIGYARVTPSIKLNRWSSDIITPSTFCSEAGHFVLEDLEDDFYTLDARMEGYAGAKVKNVAAGTGNAVIVLKDGASLEGQVVDFTGRPVADALVKINLKYYQESSIGPPKYKTKTNSAGRWIFENLHPDTYELLAMKDRLRSDKTDASVKSWDSHGQNVRLTLLEGFSVSGSIIDKKTRQGIPAVKVSPSPRDNHDYDFSYSQLESESDRYGRFEITNLPAGDYRFYLSKIPNNYSPDPEPRDLEISLSDHDMKDLVFELQPGGRLMGTVLTPNGLPAEGAYVSYERYSQGSFSQDFEIHPESKRTTDVHGKFDLTGVNECLKARLSAKMKGYAPGYSEAFKLAEEETIQDLQIFLQPAGSISGQVRDTTGNLLGKDYSVVAIPPMAIRDFSRVEYASIRSGRYRVEDLPEGKYIVSVNGPGVESASNEREVVVKASEETTGIDFIVVIDFQPEDDLYTSQPEKLEYFPGSISGLVLDESGNPVPGAWLYAYCRQIDSGDSGFSSTGTDGRFCIENLNQGLFSIDVHPPNDFIQTHKKYSAQVPGDEIEIVLEHRPSISGQVVNRSDGTPVPSFQIGLLQMERYRSERLKMISHPQGKFTIENVLPGIWTIRVQAGKNQVADRQVEVRTGENITDLKIELSDPNGITGRVIGKKSREPVDGARISAQQGAPINAYSGYDSGYTSTKTDATGHYTLSGLAAGWDSLIIAHPAYGKKLIHGIEVTEGEIGEIDDIELEDPGFVEGFVYNSEGAPVEQGAIILAQIENAEDYELITIDSKGFYQSPPLNMGTYILTYRTSDSDYPDAIKRADVKEGQTVRVDFGKGGATLWGKVTRGDQPVSGAELVISGRYLGQFGMVSSKTGADGIYREESLQPGLYQVSLQEKEDSPNSYLKEIDLESRKEYRLDFKFPGTSLAGKVTDGRNGEPARYVRIVLRTLSDRNQVFSESRTEKEGTYQFKSIQPGDYYLQALCRDGASQGRKIHLEDGEQREGEDFEFDQGGSLLTTLWDQQTGSILQGKVFLFNEEGFSVNPGREGSQGYQILQEELPPGRLLAVAMEMGFGTPSFGPSPRWVTIQTGEITEEDFYLTPGCVLKIDVYNTQGEIISAPHMQLIDQDGNDWFQLPYNVLMDSLPPDWVIAIPGNYDLKIQKESFRGHSRRIVIDPSERERAISIELLRDMTEKYH